MKFSPVIKLGGIVLNLCLWYCGMAQYQAISTLEPGAGIEQKLRIKNEIQQYLYQISSLSERWKQSGNYFETAKVQGDSLFLAHSLGQLALMSAMLTDTFKYTLEGQSIRSTSTLESLYLPENINHIYRYTHEHLNEYLRQYEAIQSNIGVYLQEIPEVGKLDLYPALSIFKDPNGGKTFAEVAANKDWFTPNATMTQYDAGAVYWVKLKLRGNELGQDTCLFFVENSEGFQSWDQIDAYLVHENGAIEQRQTGIKMPKSQKLFNRYNNLLSFGMAQHEKATLYLRLSVTTGRRSPTYISLKATRQKKLSDINAYEATGRFEYSSDLTPFRGNRLDIQNMYVDTSNAAPIEQIIANWAQLPHQYAYDITVKPKETYWVKIKLIGSTQFAGKQLFHVSPYPFPGTDVFGFDRYDAYLVKDGQILSHQQTGGTVPLSKRQLRFWANFIEADVMPNDTFDLYIRMSGTHRPYYLSRFDFWHIDPDSVFPNQVTAAMYNSIYFGVLAIQCLFFLLLFFIERDRIHLYFALLILGLFLGNAFVDDNYRNFVMFPGLRPYHIPLFFIGIYLIQVGFIKFSEAYFDYPKSSVWSKYVIPGFLTISALINLNAIWKFQYLVPAYYPVDERYHVAAVFILMIGLGLSFLLGLIAKGRNKVLKRFFVIAFLPGFLMIFVLMLRSITPENSALLDFMPEVLSLYNAVRFTTLAMLLLLALSMGYRTNLLKSDKQKALQENLKSQQILIEQLQQTDQLQELVRLKTRFYTNITHEFRTPLTVILGMTEQSNHPQAMALIRRNGKKLLQLINQLLDLSKLDSGVLKANYQQIEIVSFTQYIGESFQSLAEQKYIRLTIYSEIEHLWMDMDEERYRQIISNLLSNAIKFTPESGKIILHLSEKNEQLILKIKDNGIGISQDALPHIFDRFYQVDNSQSQQGEGTGIGLSLVKELVNLLEGDINVESQLNTGTTFEIRFPIRHEATQKLEHFDAPAPTDANSTASIAFSGDEDEYASGPKLLLIEDNPDVVIYLQSFLSQYYDLMMASNGEDGIQKAIEEIPDIVISDVMMPKKMASRWSKR